LRLESSVPTTTTPAIYCTTISQFLCNFFPTLPLNFFGQVPSTVLVAMKTYEVFLFSFLRRTTHGISILTSSKIPWAVFQNLKQNNVDESGGGNRRK
jgi:hypothetical protein